MKLLTQIMVVFVFLGVVSVAHSAETAKPLFARQPRGILKDPTQLLAFVNNDRKCGKATARTWRNLFLSYKNSAEKNDDAGTERVYAQLQELIDAYAKKGEVCRQVARNFYGVGSLSILLLNSTDPRLKKSENFKSNNDLNGHIHEYLRDGYSTVVGLAAVSLVNKGIVTWFDESQRQCLGGDWTAQKGGSYKIFGAYDCLDTKMMIDSKLRPYDLGAVYIHEMSHYFRDKLFVVPSGQIDMKTYVLLDETLAAVHGAYYQIALEGFKHDVEWWPQHRNDINGPTPPTHFKLENDIQLYRRGGPLSQITKCCSLGENFFEFVFNFLKNRGETFVKAIGTKLWQPVRSIYESILQGYFREALQQEQEDKLNSWNLGKNIESLSFWAKSLDPLEEIVPGQRRERQVLAWQPSDIPGYENDFFSNQGRRWIRRAVKSLIKLHGEPDFPTLSCLRFHETTELSQYYGNEVPVTAACLSPEGEGGSSKPQPAGGESIKPAPSSGESIKPSPASGESIKPEAVEVASGESIKPGAGPVAAASGGESIKPSAPTTGKPTNGRIKPCINFNDQI